MYATKHFRVIEVIKMLYDITRSKDVRRSNRYRKCLILKDLETGDTLLSTRCIPTITETPQDTVHTVKYNEVCRLDLLAYNYYNNALLWWVIAEANNIVDPFIEIKEGTQLRIPSIEGLYAEGGVLG